MLEPTLRSSATQKRYERDRAAGRTKNIAKLPAAKLHGLKILANEYQLDLVYKDNDMLIDQSGNFWDFWIKLGHLIQDGQIPYDQILMNMKHKQSQSHVEHVHLVNFKDTREEFTL